MQLKILHTSDWHLGAPFKFLRQKDHEQKKRQRNAIKEIEKIVKDESIHIVLIAGDTFDTPYPSIENSRLVETFLSSLAAENVYVALIAGNHDYYAESSVWKRLEVDKKYIKIFEPETEVWSLPELDACIVGLSVSSKHDKTSPLKKIEPLEEKNIATIGLFHGAIDTRGKGNGIDKGDFDKSHFNYIALGDWHGVLDVSTPQTPAWYCGTPEMVTVNQPNSGNVLISTIENNKTTVTILQTGKTSVLVKEIDVTGIKNQAELMSEISLLIDPNEIVTVTLTGVSGFYINEEKILEELQDSFYYIKIKNNTRSGLSEKLNTDNLLLNTFLEILEKKKSTLDQKTYQNALQLGIHLLDDPASDED